MKFCELGRSFFRKMVQIRSNFVTTCTIKGTRGAKLPVDATVSGRSMVEMLGVLAIIGVLSVGAISGYSKAMFKYKLNKQAEQLNTVINAVARYKNSFSAEFRGHNITSYFIKLGEIPTEMIGKDSDFIKDSFGNSWQIYYLYDAQSGIGSMNLAFSSELFTTKSGNALEICRAILLTAKENSSSIANIGTLSGYQQDDQISEKLVGDQYCSVNNNCLRNISLDEIYNICTKHIGKQSVEFKIEWRI